MNFLLQHTSLDRIPMIGIEEITQFLDSLRNSLSSASDMELWQRFMIESTKFRARLAGIEYKTVNGNGKRS